MPGPLSPRAARDCQDLTTRQIERFSDARPASSPHRAFRYVPTAAVLTGRSAGGCPAFRASAHMTCKRNFLSGSSPMIKTEGVIDTGFHGKIRSATNPD
jgi:hypothetical protein